MAAEITEHMGGNQRAGGAAQRRKTTSKPVIDECWFFGRELNTMELMAG